MEKEDFAYYGIEFGCTWDEEHGLGIMIHRSRVVSVGGADEAILSWIAENDRDSKAFDEIKDVMKMACNIRF